MITPGVDGVRWKTSVKKMTAAIWEIPCRRINMWILYPALLFKNKRVNYEDRKQRRV